MSDNKMIFKCRTITPMFLTGADGKAPELRPPSIKGVMRFWWRAIKAEDKITDLQREESKIFGGGGEAANRSKIRLRIKEQPITREWRMPQGNGASYLLYSIQKGRYYIEVDSMFDLQINATDSDSLKYAAASFWAAVYLGGLGNRSRRGGGNVIIDDVIGCLKDIDLKFQIKGANSDEVAGWLTSNFEKARNIIKGGRSDNFVSTYSNLSFARFVICPEPKNNWVDSLNEIGMIYKEFRDAHKSEICDKAAFGLPLQYRKNRYVKVQYDKDINRRSSPLFFKVLELKDRYYWFVLRLSGEFLPKCAFIKADSKQKPDYRLIDEFWKMLIKDRGKEYILAKPRRLDNTIERIKKDVAPERIILFGSKARGDFHNRSDIDIAVDTERSIEEININGAVDIIDLKRAKQGLKDKIDIEGVVIYERKG